MLLHYKLFATDELFDISSSFRTHIRLTFPETLSIETAIDIYDLPCDIRRFS